MPLDYLEISKLMDSINISATYDKLGFALVLKSHLVFPAKPFHQFHHILEVDDCRAMNPYKFR